MTKQRRRQRERLTVSYSAVQDWRECQQLYHYRNVERLKPKVRHHAPELGTVLHAYFDVFYRSFIGRKATPDRIRRAHRVALKKAITDHQEEILRLARLAESVGSNDAAKAILAIPETARNLARAYYRVRGRHDLRRHKVVITEQSFEIEVRSGVYLPGRIDMITKTKEGYWLWEHKTSGSIPDREARLRDLQILLYRIACEELFDIQLYGIVWNHVRTTPPHRPKLIRKGAELSRAKDQITTRELCLAAIRENGFERDDYEDVLRVVERRERQQMFQRYTLPVVRTEDILLRDYLRSVDEIQDFRASGREPVRHISRSCDWCAYLKMCESAIMGGDLAYIRKQYYMEDRDGKKH